MAHSFPFDVILFDVGGVLLTNSWDRRERAAVAAELHLDPRELETRHLDIDSAWERGGMTMAAYLDFVIFHERRAFTRDQFISCMLDQSKLLPGGAMDVLKELAASGKYLLGAFNNEAREINEYRFKTFGLRHYFRIALSSCYLGLRKPEPAMYQRAIDIVGAPPERILFIDDRQENVVGAVTAGLTALRFTGIEDLRRELADRGLLSGKSA
jgi:putative hydrolase of the HAD superfamily